MTGLVSLDLESNPHSILIKIKTKAKHVGIVSV